MPRYGCVAEFCSELPTIGLNPLCISLQTFRVLRNLCCANLLRCDWSAWSLHCLTNRRGTCRNGDSSSWYLYFSWWHIRSCPKRLQPQAHRARIVERRAAPRNLHAL